MTDAEMHHAMIIRPQNLFQLKKGNACFDFWKLMGEQQVFHYLIIDWPIFEKSLFVLPRCTETEMHPIQNTIVPAWKNRNEDAMIAAVHIIGCKRQPIADQHENFLTNQNLGNDCREWRLIFHVRKVMPLSESDLSTTIWDTKLDSTFNNNQRRKLENWRFKQIQDMTHLTHAYEEVFWFLKTYRHSQLYI